MTWDKGLGTCLIPTETGIPCGLHIQEGEPIGTVVSFAGPVVGHKKCADAYTQRKKDEQMVKIGKQQGPGGSIGDPSSYAEGIMGSIPLEKPEPPEPPFPLSSVPPPATPQPVDTHEGRWPAATVEVNGVRQEGVWKSGTTGPRAPEGGWQLEDFPQITVVSIPYATNTSPRPDPAISFTTEGQLVMDLGGVRLAFPDRVQWTKLTHMVECLWNTFEDTQGESA